MWLKGIVARCGLLLLLALGPAATAQETQQTEDPPAAPQETTEPAAQAEQPPPPEPPEKTGSSIALYIEAGGGAYEPDDVDPSIETLSTHVSKNLLSFSEQKFSRAAIGWKLKKGDLRLVFNGYSEDGYTLESVGLLSAVDPAIGTAPDVLGPLTWWELTTQDGILTSRRTPPVWDPNTDDTNGNGFIDPGEQQYPFRDDQGNIVTPAQFCPNNMPCAQAVDLSVIEATAKTLQNRAQTYDLVFGQVWGPRRFQGRWFAGFRYFLYEGNIPAAAWLFTDTTGDGFTDGAFLKTINFAQKTTGLGPTGLMEARVNFFDQVLQLYINGQATFIVLSIDVDSGTFTTIVREGTTGRFLPAAAQLQEDLTKSTWQTGAEAGIRVRLKSGLKLEVSYGVAGYLDAILLPTEIRIPENSTEASQGTSAIYNTQDYVLQGWRAGIAFQF